MMRVWRVSHRWRHGRTVLAETEEQAKDLYRLHMYPRFQQTAAVRVTEEVGPLGHGMYKQALLDENRMGVIVQTTDPVSGWSNGWTWAT